MRKKYFNFCITWNEDGAKREEILFCKADAIRAYINLLFARSDSDGVRDISGLQIFGITKRDFQKEELTGAVNRFLN